MSTMTYAEFVAEAQAQGFDEVLERVWLPGQVVDTHSHPFEVSALVVRGELWLACDGAGDTGSDTGSDTGGETRHLLPGDRFQLGMDQPHTERYGPEGATFWAARRHASV